MVVAAVGRLAGRAPNRAWRMGFTLPAGGEFAFVLFALAARQHILDARAGGLPGARRHLVDDDRHRSFSGCTTACVRRSWAPCPARRSTSSTRRDNRVIIAGFGRFGQIVSRVLRARHIKFTALDSSQTHVDFVRRFGNRIYYGDASRLDLLRAAGAESADIFVLAIDDVDASVRTAEIVRTVTSRRLKILARARNRQHAFALMDNGVDYIVRETLRLEPGVGRGRC